MEDIISRIRAWRNFVSSFAREYGYHASDSGTIFFKGGIGFEIQERMRGLNIIVRVDVNRQSAVYDISSTRSCLDFCLLLQAIEDLRV